MIRWIDPKPIDASSLASLDLPPLIAELLVRRGVRDAPSAQIFLHPESQPPARYPGLEKAVDRLQAAIRKGESICVWGDFDADGQTATAVLVEALQRLAGRVNHYIPNRANEGHGLHVGGLRSVIDQGAKLILTCDTGITASEAVVYANNRGADVLITDHHELGDALPPALSIINPKLLPSGHPLSYLTGVGVAYKVTEALFDASRQEHAPGLDLAAIGLVADVANLTGESRRLAHEGILALRQTPRIGLRAIADLAEISLATATEETIGYALAPRLNAVGRLGDARLAVELLLTADPVRGNVIAAQLEGYNTQRRLLTEQVLEAAEDWLLMNPSAADKPILVLEHAAWPGGVLGIVAGRLRESYHKPAVLLSESEHGVLRGSARSIEGVHITQAIASQRSHLLAFGGHPMAAGLSLPKDALPAFRIGIEKAVAAMLRSANIEEATLQIDAWLALNQVSMQLASQVEQLAPFGVGNASPVFATRSVWLKSSRPIGREGEHQRLLVQDEQGAAQELLWWDARMAELPKGRFDLAYSVRAETYAGAPRVSLQVLEIRQPEARAIEVANPETEIIDLRRERDPAALPKGCLIWAEGTESARGVDRFHLQPTQDLAIWTAPPSPRELRAALEVARPGRIFLLASMPPKDETAESFLTRLAGLAKYALNQQGGKSKISILAAACAQRDLTVRLGLEWIAAGGHLQSRVSGDEVELTAEIGETKPTSQKELFAAVKSLLNEAAAYRRHFFTADAGTLL